MATRMYITVDGIEYRSALFEADKDRMTQDTRKKYLAGDVGVGLFILDDGSNLILGPEAMNRAHIIFKSEPRKPTQPNMELK